MKSMKLSVCALSAAMLLCSCGGMTNTAKGGLIGGASGGALGALVGQLIGKGKGAGYPEARLVSVKGYGEENPVADNATAAGKKENRRVEVYILPSKDMIEAANKEAGNK